MSPNTKGADPPSLDRLEPWKGHSRSREAPIPRAAASYGLKKIPGWESPAAICTSPGFSLRVFSLSLFLSFYLSIFFLCIPALSSCSTFFSVSRCTCNKLRFFRSFAHRGMHTGTDTVSNTGMHAYIHTQRGREGGREREREREQRAR